ncbi:MAG: WYL domain-containing protein [Thermotaleaceae bacterium]
MNLFVKPKNKSYVGIVHLIHQFIHSPDRMISRKEIIDFLRNNGINDPYLVKAILRENEDPKDNLYILEKIIGTEQYMLSCEEEIDFQPIHIEKVWLKHMLKDQKAALFLEKGTYEKLELKLEEVEDVLEENLLFKNYKSSNTVEHKNFYPAMNIILEALYYKKAIIYTYGKKDGVILKNRSAWPFKVEYSIKDDLFYLILYPLDTEKPRPIKSLITNFLEIEILDREISADKIEELTVEAIEEQKVREPVVLEIHNNRNSLERAFRLFSCFEKRAKYIEDRDVHLLSIYYYHFEEKEVLSRIFSLGKEALVLGPKAIQNQIIYSIQKILGKDD